MAIKKDTLHPENEPEIDIYPKTSIDQVENLQANLDALNGDLANVNGEIANIANRVGDINKDVSTLKYNDINQDRRIQVLENTSGTTINRVEIVENNISDIRDDITVLNTAYGSYTDYTEVTNGFLLTYLSGKQIELPIKAGTNVTFSKYPGTNQIVINATGGNVPDPSSIPTLTGNNTWSGKNIFNNGITTGITKYADYITYRQYKFNFPNKNGTLALVEDIPNTSSFPTLAGNNKWTGDNIFDGFSKSIRVNGLFQVSGDEELISATYNQVSYDGFNITYMDGENQNIFHIGIDFENKARFGFDKYDGSSYNLYIPEKDGTIALLSDIPISLMYSSSRLGVNSVDFPFNTDKNYFFTITMTNTGESKSFIYAKGTNATYTIVINSSTSFEVKLDATGSTRLIFTNKSNADPFVVRAEISK